MTVDMPRLIFQTNSPASGNTIESSINATATKERGAVTQRDKTDAGLFDSLLQSKSGADAH